MKWSWFPLIRLKFFGDYIKGMYCTLLHPDYNNGNNLVGPGAGGSGSMRFYASPVPIAVPSTF